MEMSNATFSPTNSSTNSAAEPPLPSLRGTAASYVIGAVVVILIVAALAANLFVCLAVYKQRSARRITRYFITNLCAADILVAVISMPVWLIFVLYDNDSASFVLGSTFVLIWTHVDILCGTASIMSLTSISVDRYVAVSRPYDYVRWITVTRAIVVMGAIWVYSTLVALMQYPLRHLKYFKGGYAIFMLFASFLVPLVVIVTAYSCMFRIAMRHSRDLSSVSQNTGNRQRYKVLKRDLKAAKTFAFVIGTFVCCWTPFIVVSFCFAFIPTLDPDGANVAKWLSYLNTVLSPVVYSCIDKQLRRLVSRKLSFLTCARFLRRRRKELKYRAGQTCCENTIPLTEMGTSSSSRCLREL